MHSDQIEFCVSYDFLIASSRAPIVKAPLYERFQNNLSAIAKEHQWPDTWSNDLQVHWEAGLGRLILKT